MFVRGHILRSDVRLAKEKIYSKILFETDNKKAAFYKFIQDDRFLANDDYLFHIVDLYFKNLFNFILLI